MKLPSYQWLCKQQPYLKWQYGFVSINDNILTARQNSLKTKLTKFNAACVIFPQYWYYFNICASTIWNTGRKVEIICFHNRWKVITSLDNRMKAENTYFLKAFAYVSFWVCPFLVTITIYGISITMRMGALVIWNCSSLFFSVVKGGVGRVHQKKLSRAMRDAWTDHFGNNQIYCDPLSKKVKKWLHNPGYTTRRRLHMESNSGNSLPLNPYTKCKPQMPSNVFRQGSLTKFWTVLFETQCNP